MRLNTVPPSTVTQPGIGSEIGGIAAARGIGAQSAGAVLVPRPQPAEPEVATPAPAPTADRRVVERRSAERRTQKLPILLEMRVGPRRTARRRANDAPATSVDTKA